MKLTNITNVDKFFEVIDKCEGKVEMLTENGKILFSVPGKKYLSEVFNDDK